MAAVCAACQQPLAPGEKFVLSRTEVFHAACAAAGGIARSVRARLEIRVIEAEHDARTARDQLQAARRELEEARRRVKKLSDDRDDLERDYRRTRTVRDGAVHTSELWKQRAMTAERELEQVRRDQVAPRTVPVSPAPVAPPIVADTAKADDRDATEIRFSLLELDKT